MAKPIIDPVQVFKDFRAFGLSELDSKLLTNCINQYFACSWVNNDHITTESLQNVVKYIEEKQLGIAIDVMTDRTGKFVWEVKIRP